MRKIKTLIVSFCSKLFRRREKTIMSKTKNERKNYVRKLIEDIFVDGIERAISTNKLTVHEANKWYNLLAKYFELKDLKIPEPESLPEDPKEYLQVSIARIKNSPRLNGNLFPKIKTVRTNPVAELKSLKKYLETIDESAIEAGRVRAKALSKEDKRSRPPAKGAHNGGQST